MTEPHIIHCSVNHRIRWHSVPVNPYRVTPERLEQATDVTPDGAIVGLYPDLWATELAFLFQRVYQSAVGRVLVDSIHRRTTVYHGDRASTDVDTLTGLERHEALARAATIGTAAIMFLNLANPPAAYETGLMRTPEISLVHELAHAMHITQGCYVRTQFYAPEDERRFHSESPEETGALIIENMYRVERGVPARATYVGNRALPPGELPTNRNTGSALSAAERFVVQRLELGAYGVAQRLADLRRQDCPYNPFRELLRR